MGTAQRVQKTACEQKRSRNKHGQCRVNHLRRFARFLCAAAKRHMRQPHHKADNIFAEIRHDGEQRAEMQRHIHCDPMVGQAGQPMCQGQMSRRRNGDEFGDALDKGQNENVIKCHKLN